MAESAKADGASVAAQAPTPVAQAAEDALRAPSPTPRDLLALLWRRYLAQLSAHPLRTKCVTAGGVAAASDLLGQTLSKPGPPALPRTLKFALFGALWSGPALHYWQRTVERLFASSPPSLATAAWKVLLDQLSFGPANNIAFMAFFALVLERAGMGALLKRLRSDLLRVQLAAWRFWPLVAAFSYRCVPPPLRPLVANVAGLCWSTFLVMSARGAALPAKPKVV